MIFLSVNNLGFAIFSDKKSFDTISNLEPKNNIAILISPNLKNNTFTIRFCIFFSTMSSLEFNITYLLYYFDCTKYKKC